MVKKKCFIQFYDENNRYGSIEVSLFHINSKSTEKDEKQQFTIIFVSILSKILLKLLLGKIHSGPLNSKMKKFSKIFQKFFEKFSKFF